MKKVLKQILGPQNTRRLIEWKVRIQNPTTFWTIKQNSQFRNLHIGQRCFILGNGPSLKKIDFSLLQNEITFTVNQLPRNPQFDKLHTNYHFWADERFFDLHEDRQEDMELLKVMRSVRTADNNPVVFYKLAAWPMIKKYALDKELNIFYYGEYHYTNRSKVLSNFVDFTKFVPNFATVVHYIICMAVYMGFKEIYLLGCDCTGFISTIQARLNNAQAAEYGYIISENEKKRMTRISSLTSLADELQWHGEIFQTYDYLQQYCARYGVKLYNATEGGLLESLPRVYLQDVVAKK